MGFYAWDASHSCPPDDHFLMRFLSYVPILSVPVKIGYLQSFEISKRARWEQQLRVGPPGIYRDSTLLHWYQFASPPFCVISLLRDFGLDPMFISVLFPSIRDCLSGRVFY